MAQKLKKTIPKKSVTHTGKSGVVCPNNTTNPDSMLAIVEKYLQDRLPDKTVTTGKHPIDQSTAKDPLGCSAVKAISELNLEDLTNCISFNLSELSSTSKKISDITALLIGKEVVFEYDIPVFKGNILNYAEAISSFTHHYLDYTAALFQAYERALKKQ